MTLLAVGTDWTYCVDVCEHHYVDFAEVARQGADAVIVRAGRGTRQDARWIEHVRAAVDAGLDVGSYWHLYPSHTDAHHQADLWMAAIDAAARWDFGRWHWADITTTDGFDRHELRRYAAAFLRRVDARLGETVGIFTSYSFWRHRVGFDDTRPRWVCGVHPIDAAARVVIHGMRMRASDRGGPGWHLARPLPRSPSPTGGNGMRLPVRHADESIADWQSRWIRSPDVVDLQEQLNAAGATLVVDGVFGPATATAQRTHELLLRRDREQPTTDPDARLIVTEGFGNPARPVPL